MWRPRFSIFLLSVFAAVVYCDASGRPLLLVEKTPESEAVVLNEYFPVVLRLFNIGHKPAHDVQVTFNLSALTNGNFELKFAHEVRNAPELCLVRFPLIEAGGNGTHVLMVRPFGNRAEDVSSVASMIVPFLLDHAHYLYRDANGKVYSGTSSTGSDHVHNIRVFSQKASQKIQGLFCEPWAVYIITMIVLNAYYVAQVLKVRGEFPDKIKKRH